MDKNPLLGRLMKDTKEDVVHSSAYAEAQNAGGMGAASTQSFAKRQEIEANRTTIQGYRDSRVVSDAFGSGGTKLQEYDAAHDASQRAAIRERFGGERNTGTNDKVSGNAGGDNGAGAMGRTMPTGRTTVPPVRRNPGISR